jgi:hypothetical protein
MEIKQEGQPRVGKHPIFLKTHLETIVHQRGYNVWVKKLEDERCETDLMYRLFKRPETIVDTLLPGLVELIEKKNAPDLGDSRMHRDAMSFLFKHPRVDAKIKLFYILLIVAREPEAQTVIRAGYDKSNNSLWGDQWEKRANAFFKHLGEHVIRMYGAPFGETNIEERIGEFLIGAELLYVSNYT